VTTTPSLDSTTLKARTVMFDGPRPDLISEAGESGLLWRESTGGLAGNGVAMRIDLPGGLADVGGVQEAIRLLNSIEVDDEVGLPGCGAVAIGALPFDRLAPAHLIVPRRIVGISGTQAWITTIEPASGEEGPAVGDGSPPDHFSLTSSMPHADWKAMVAGALDAIKRGEFRKVVLARRVEITSNRPFVMTDVLSRLEALYPSCMVFSVGGFIGASPELLIRREGLTVESHPLAGTVARSGDTRSDDALVAGLMASEKARHEHQVVVDALQDTLEQVCAEIDVPPQPSVMALRNVSHLATHITGRLADGRPAHELPSALELAARLHPTPAVGGDPTDAAVDYLKQVEGFDRGYYAGPVGWVDARGDGAFAVGIRCAEVNGARARIYAGNGVVEGSDPGDELVETQLKLQALLAALVRP
jgi:menaquinone-specific isochorismate synthase